MIDGKKVLSLTFIQIFYSCYGFIKNWKFMTHIRPQTQVYELKGFKMKNKIIL